MSHEDVCRMSAGVFQSTEGAGTNKLGALKTTPKASMAKAQHTRRKVVFGAERGPGARSQILPGPYSPW